MLYSNKLLHKNEMSIIFTSSENSSVLSEDFSSPLYFDDEFEYKIGLSTPDSYN